MNLYIEQNPIGTQADGSPLFGLRLVLNGRDVVPTNEQRERVLGLMVSLGAPAKEEPKAPAKNAPKPSEK